MSREPLTLEPRNYPKPHNVVGIDITVLVSREATGGHEITLQTGDKGSGPPPHSHPWDESFYVVRGAVDFTVEGKTTKAGPGTFFHLPAGTVHAFCIQGNRSGSGYLNNFPRFISGRRADRGRCKGVHRERHLKLPASSLAVRPGTFHPA